MGIRTWLTGKGPGTIAQANALHQAETPAWTPYPVQDDWGSVHHGTLSRTFHNLPTPSPDEIEWLYGRSDEWSSVVVRIRNEVWRRGILVESTHQKFCQHCGEGTDDPQKGCVDKTCPGHGEPDRLLDPDPMGKEVMRTFMDHANKTERENLTDVGSKKTEENLKHGRGYIVYHYQYELEDEGSEKGTIVTARLQQLHAASSARIVKLRDPETGRPGGAFVCLACRPGKSYEPEERPGRCTKCNSVLYEAWFAEKRFPGSAPKGGLNWYLPSEVHETKWPYSNGSPPIGRLMAKISTLLLMDWYAAWALDLKRDKKPDKILVTIGGDEGSIKAWLKRVSEQKKRNPYAPTVLHMPHPPGLMGDFKMDAKVLDMGDKEFKGQMPELREAFEKRIKKQYHLTTSPDDAEQSGGLNNEGLRLRTTAQVAEDIQNHEQKWLDRIPEALGVSQWKFVFPPPLEEDEARETGVLSAQLDVAMKAASAGLSVRWEDGEAVIEDGTVKAPEPSQFPPLGGGGSDSMFGRGGGLDMGKQSQSVVQAEDRILNDPLPNLEAFKQAYETFKQAVTSDEALPQDLSALFGGPSGAIAASDAAYQSYAGLDADTIRMVNEQIIDSMSQPQGWSTKSIAERVQEVLVERGMELADASRRALIIARTEPAAIAAEWRVRTFQQEEKERNQTFRYTLRGANDFRTTKLSRWIRQQIPSEGLPLEQVLTIIDQGIELAKNGAFKKNGSLSSVQGDPIELPQDFQRRGTIAHFGERDTLVRVV